MKSILILASVTCPPAPPAYPPTEAIRVEGNNILVRSQYPVWQVLGAVDYDETWDRRVAEFSFRGPVPAVVLVHAGPVEGHVTWQRVKVRARRPWYSGRWRSRWRCWFRSSSGWPPPCTRQRPEGAGPRVGRQDRSVGADALPIRRAPIFGR